MLVLIILAELQNCSILAFYSRKSSNFLKRNLSSMMIIVLDVFFLELSQLTR